MNALSAQARSSRLFLASFFFLSESQMNFECQEICSFWQQTQFENMIFIAFQRSHQSCVVSCKDSWSGMCRMWHFISYLEDIDFSIFKAIQYFLRSQLSFPELLPEWRRSQQSQLADSCVAYSGLWYLACSQPCMENSSETSTEQLLVSKHWQLWTWLLQR